MAQKPKAPSEPTGCIRGTVHLLLRMGIERSTMLPHRIVPVKLSGPSIDKSDITGPHGTFCFDELPLDAEYTLSFARELDQDNDGFPEYRLASRQPQPAADISVRVTPTGEVEFTLTVSEAGDCAGATGPGREIDIYYEVFQESMLLDALEDFRSMRNDLDDLANYPPPPAGGVGVAAGPSLNGATLEAVAQAVFIEVLGVQPGDFAAIQRALPQRFEAKEVEGGRVVYEWKPGALVVETLLGAVKLTGDQARLYQRAQFYLEDSQELLDKMAPLNVDAEPDLVRAQKAVVLDLIKQLVAEFGREQEPRSVLVEQLFFSLLDRQTQILQEDGTPLLVQGELEALEEALGYEQVEIIDLDDEEQRTYGLMLRDNVQGLRAAWDNYLNPAPGERLMLGAQLRILSRSLATVAESIREVRAMLASVRFGPAEQRTVKFKFPSTDQDLSVDDLLSMVELFATVEAPRLIQEGKRRAAATILSLTESLHELVVEASNFPRHPFNRRRVRSAFEEVATGLEVVKESASELVNEQAPAETVGTRY